MVPQAQGDTRDRILDLAEDLLQSRGYNGFSYKDISRQLGIRNAAVHYHFPSKADLGVALIRRYRELLAARTRRFREGGSDPLIQFEGYLQFIRNETDKLERICPVGMLAADYYLLPEDVRAEGQRLAAELLDWMTRVLELGREQGIFRFDGSPRAKAVVVLTSLQGTRQLSRFAGPGALEDAIGQLRTDLGIEPSV